MALINFLIVLLYYYYCITYFFFFYITLLVIDVAKWPKEMSNALYTQFLAISDGRWIV